MVEASRCLWRRNLRLQLVNCDGFLLPEYSCETSSTARCQAVDSFLFLPFCPFNSTLHDFKEFQPVTISVPFCDFGVGLYIQDLVNLLGSNYRMQDHFGPPASGPLLFRRRFICFEIFSRWSDWHRRTFVHSLFCGAGRKTTYVYSQRQS